MGINEPPKMIDRETADLINKTMMSRSTSHTPECDDTLLNAILKRASTVVVTRYDNFYRVVAMTGSHRISKRGNTLIEALGEVLVAVSYSSFDDDVDDAEVVEKKKSKLNMKNVRISVLSFFKRFDDFVLRRKKNG